MAKWPEISNVCAAEVERLRVELEHARSELAVMHMDRDVMRFGMQAMHRRAQKAEGKMQRTAHLLETVMRSIRDVVPMLPTLPDPYPLSLHSLYHRVSAARDHARASSGRAWMEGWHYLWPKLKEAEARADRLQAERDDLAARLQQIQQAERKYTAAKLTEAAKMRKGQAL